MEGFRELANLEGGWYKGLYLYIQLKKGLFILVTLFLDIILVKNHITRLSSF